jgi:tRNA pseudouridine38-40 synthase
MPAHGLSLEEVVYPADADLASRADMARSRRELPAEQLEGAPDAH